VNHHITVENHGGTVRIVSKKPFLQSETKDVVSIEYEDEPLTMRETTIEEREVLNGKGNDA
jgi:hypothetical protein